MIARGLLEFISIKKVLHRIGTKLFCHLTDYEFIVQFFQRYATINKFAFSTH